jgi:DnaJ-class molecular chaperone
MRKREKECFRCGGTGKLSDRRGETCFVCHGKGHIDIDPTLLEEYWKRFRDRMKL